MMAAYWAKANHLKEIEVGAGLLYIIANFTEFLHAAEKHLEQKSFYSVESYKYI